jgi:hypothetical protein
MSQDLRSFLQSSWPLDSSRLLFDEAVLSLQTPESLAAAATSDEVIRKLRLAGDRNYSMSDYVEILNELLEVKKAREKLKQEQQDRVEKLENLRREEERKLREVSKR